MDRVVVTGMGLANALGPDLPTVWRRLLAGENGIAPISVFDASGYSSKVAAEVLSLPPLSAAAVLEHGTGLQSIPSAYCRRSMQLFLKSAQEAYADSGLANSGLANTEIGVASGANVNYLHMNLVRRDYRLRSGDGLDTSRVAENGGHPKTDFYRRTGDLTSAVPAKAMNLAGPNITVDMACAASSFAVGEAFRLIQRGQVTAMVAGGASALVNPIGLLAFALLGALSRNPDPEQASCPFDRRRSGFVLGEGAGAVVLENRDHALARGARIYGEVAGFGSTMNAHNLTDPSPDGACEARAMAMALREAGLAPEAIDYVAAHGTSTPKNDVTETRALKTVLGAHARKVLVSSNKGQIGHTLAAAGVTNMICALKAMNDDRVPPTAHYQNRDPECDLDYVPNESRPAKVRAALANAFAFGGQNAVLALRAV